MPKKKAGEPGRIREDLVVTKANTLIEASYRLNVSEQRCVALLAGQIHPDDEDFKGYRFKASDIQTLIESKNKDEHARLKALAEGLMKKTLKLRKLEGGWLLVNWLSSAEYFPGEGEIELCFDPKLMPYMLQLKERFTSYKLASVIKLRSRYSVRLYELLKQYEPLGIRSFELSELRKTLHLEGGELERWFDFRRKVLDIAERELPKRTDLGFSYAARKKGRAVNWIDFKIWSTRTQSVPVAKSKSLGKEAKICWDGAGNRGNCGATWEAKHDKPTDVCHWCLKFKQLREQKALEERGQQRLPGFAAA